MVTVVDPLGSPTIVFNRSGVAIIDVMAGSGSPAVIPATVAGVTVVTVTPNVGGNSQVELPAAEIGDVVEVYRIDDSQQILIFAPSGEDLPDGAANTGFSGMSGFIFRKVSATQWQMVGI